MKVNCHLLARTDSYHSAAFKKQPSSKTHFLLVLLLLGMLSIFAPSMLAQGPLNFANNFFVTGDYVVAGAYNMTSNFTTINGISYAVGTIKVPDGNPGITGTKQVPKGAQIVAALLYWQTVEKVGALGSGQNGYFRPLMYAGQGGPAAPGYAFSGTNVSGSNTVSWSSGGCTGSSTGKVLRTYRADVSEGLPIDATGNTVANGSFEVRLPSVGNSTPLTLGATLVIIYRIPTGAGGPSIPLNSIVIYDGDYAPGNAQLTMTQQVQGFYDVDHNPVSRVTHIVGDGKSNKFQTVYLTSGANPFIALPSLYGNGLPPFPGYYGTWDNPTWTFTPASNNPSNPITEDSSFATTQVKPSTSNQGCVSWGAVIVSTTVKNPDDDGILKSWKTNHGYCDASVNNGSCSGPGDPAWVDLGGAAVGQKDLFIQYDYMCSTVTGANSCKIENQTDSLSAAATASGGSTTYTGVFSPGLKNNAVVTIAGFTNGVNNGQFKVVSCCASNQMVVDNPNGVAETNPGTATYAIGPDYSFDPRLAIDTEDGQVPHTSAIEKLSEAYSNHGIVLHAIAGNAIEENQTNVSCSDSGAANPSCTFPNEPGTIGFRDGLTFIKDSNIDTATGSIGSCTPPGTVADPCVPVFQHGKKDSYHYALFSHGVGLPNWFLSDGSLKSVKQTGNTVTFTTNLPHGISRIQGPSNYATATDAVCPNGRVTVIFALTNPNLQGTFCVQNVTTNTFQITVGGSPTNFTYTSKTDPNLSVANGQVTSMSGFSDVGGQNSVISLGYGGWGPPYDSASDGNKWQVKTGTFMHELGHTLFLTHGGIFYNQLPGSNPPDYTPSFEVNCKPNVQSVMSYLFQFDLLQVPNQLNSDGKPQMVADYSEESLSPLSESSPQAAGYLSNTHYAKTAWFQLVSDRGGSSVSPHCDGTPLTANDLLNPYAYQSDFVNNFFWGFDPLTLQQTGNDINFDGNSTDVMNGHDEWNGTPAQSGIGPAPGIDLLQVSALGTVSALGPGGDAGGLHPGGGGGLHPGGGGGLHPGGGGGLHPGGGGGLSSDITHELANSYARPPQDLTIVQEEASPRLIDLSWFAPTFGTPVQYNIYRTVVGTPFPNAPTASVPGSQTTYQDTVTCNPNGYRYEVTAVTNNDQGQPQESVPSNIVPASREPLLTGCYNVINFTPPTNAVQGTAGVQIPFTFLDDYFVSAGNGWENAQPQIGVTNNNLSATTLYAVGPTSNNNCETVTQGKTLLVSKGAPQIAGDTFASSGDVFTFTWNSTDNFCAGSYTFELDLDSGQTFTSSALQLGIDVNDKDAPHINPASLTDATVGVLYGNVLTEDGGVGTVAWSISQGSLPIGITLTNGANNTGVLSGTACVSGSSNFTALVTDSATPKANSATQGFTLQVDKGSTTTSVVSSPNPSVFQQSVIFTVTVTPQGTCGPPTGTVTLLDGATQIGSTSLSNGTAMFTFSGASSLSVGVHSITASYGGDSNFTGSSSGLYSQTINPAVTMIVASPVSPSPAFVGQPITVSWTFSVVGPGAGAPIPPSGTITVIASDGNNPANTYSCMTAAVQGAGMCTLSPLAVAAGNVTFTINYPGDGNFVMSGANGNFNVYKLVFTTQPSNTGVGNTITPAVVVTAEDSGNNPLDGNGGRINFTGGVTLALGSGPGTLSGALTQNAVAGVATFNDVSINKIATGDTLTAAPQGGVPDATSSPFNIDTFYIDNQGNFGTLDLPSGTVTQIGNAPVVPGANGLDLVPGTPSSQLFAYTASNQLFQITPATGVATQVASGTTGSIPNQATSGALTTGSYFAIDAATGILYSINTTAGTTTPVGGSNSDGVVLPPGCTFETSLSGAATTLYYTVGYAGASCSSTPMPDTLYQIDPTTGTPTLIGQLTISGSPANDFVGSAYVGGTLYGFTNTGQEYTIDPGTGTATLVGSTAPANTVPPNNAVTIIGAGSQ